MPPCLLHLPHILVRARCSFEARIARIPQQPKLRLRRKYTVLRQHGMPYMNGDHRNRLRASFWPRSM